MSRLPEIAGEVRGRWIRGVRGAMLLNVAATPLSFATNLLLGHISAEALGYYGAILIYVGTFFTLLVLGGPSVFTRFLPVLEPRDRRAFYLSYAALVAAVMTAAIAMLVIAFRRQVEHGLVHFGSPPLAVAVVMLFLTFVAGFTSYFLYGLLETAKAVSVEKLVIGGFFVAATLGFTSFRGRLDADPAGFLWLSAMIIYGAAAALGVVLVIRTPEFRQPGELRWLLPRGFAPVVIYAHLETIVTFIYSSLAPFLVLVWLDASALGYLHAANRFVVLFALLPLSVGSATGPGMSHLEASGLREEGYRQSKAAIRASLLLLTPVAIGMIFFAGDAMALFGPAFRAQRILLRILATSLVATPLIYCGGGVAVAVGAFRSYLSASLAYVVAAVLLTFALVPTLGLTGAALAGAAGALVRNVVIALLLRRLRFPSLSPLWAAWLSTLGALCVAWYWDPSRMAGALLAVVFIAAFAIAARVRPAEVQALARRALGKT